jgi:hypothetical protein
MEEQEKAFQQTAEENDRLFRELGIDREALAKFFNDKSRFSQEAWKLLEERKKKLEELIEKKIAECNTSSKPKNENDKDPQKGHWIFVR